MLPECLKDLIGVKCLTTSKSGFYINDLEGLNLKYAADIADSDYMSGLQFLKSKIDFASALVVAEISKYALPFFRVNSFVDQVSAGDWKNNYLAPLAANRGVRINIGRSRLLRINVYEIEVKIQQGNYTHSVTIVDGINTTTLPFTTDSTGYAKIVTDYYSLTNMIYVTMDDTAINVNNSGVKSGCNCSSVGSSYLTAYGWNGANIANSSYGLNVKASAKCNQDDIACLLSSKLIFPILYRSGLEIAKEAATTDRLNPITILDDEKVNYLLKVFSMEYENHMKILVEGIPDLMKRFDDCCIICNQTRYVTGMP